MTPMKSHLHDCLNATGVRMVSVDVPKWSGTGAVSQGLHPAQELQATMECGEWEKEDAHGYLSSYCAGAWNNTGGTYKWETAGGTYGAIMFSDGRAQQKCNRIYCPHGGASSGRIEPLFLK